MKDKSLQPSIEETTWSNVTWKLLRTFRIYFLSPITSLRFLFWLTISETFERKFCMCMWSLSYNSKFSYKVFSHLLWIHFSKTYQDSLISLLALKILGKILLLTTFGYIEVHLYIYIFIHSPYRSFVELLSNSLHLLVALNMYLQKILTHLVRQNTPNSWWILSDIDTLLKIYANMFRVGLVNIL